jgi:YggT family protein
MSALVLATVRSDIANYVGTFILVYWVLIFVRILMSWIPRMPYYRWLDLVLRFVTEVTDPWLNIFRRVIPPVRAGPAAIDVSAIVAMFVLYPLLQTVAVRLIAG